MHSERMAHRNRLSIMSRYFGHVLSLPLSFHGDIHSGRLMKVMLGGSDALFGLWLTFFREQFSTYVAVVVLLPLTFFMNWRLALTLVVLVVLFIAVTLYRRAQDRSRPAPGRVLPLGPRRHRPGRAVQRHGGAELHAAGRREPHLRRRSSTT